MILLIAGSSSSHCDLVEQALRKRNAEFFRLNTDRLGYDYFLTIRQDKDFWKITIRSSELQLSDDLISSVWWFGCDGPACFDISKDDMEFARKENERLLTWWLDETPIPVLCRPKHVIAASNKIKQLSLAKKLGFAVPETYISNDFNVIQNFLCTNSQCVYKPVSHSFLGISENPEVLYTNLITCADLDESSLSICVGIFQQFINKESELRITVIGDRLFAAKIRNQESQQARVDWRRYDIAHTPHEPVCLPDSFRNMCIELVSSLGLYFGAIDAVETKDRQFVFLEINPAGLWAWIQYLTGLPIAEAIADWLISSAE